MAVLARHSQLQLAKAENLAKFNANPATQCRSNPVSGRRLPKMGIFQISAGDYRRFRSVIVGIGSLETERQKAAIGGHFSHFCKYNLQLPDRLADLGGFEPAHSRLEKAL
jgi:hypothetical protein